MDRLRPLLRACITGEGEGGGLRLDAINRRGRPIRCDVVCGPLREASGEIRGVIVLMEDHDGRAPLPA